MHEVQQDIVADKQIDMVNINSFGFSSIQSVIIAKLKLGRVKIMQLYNAKLKQAVMAIYAIPYFYISVLQRSKGAAGSKIKQKHHSKTYNKTAVRHL